MECPNHVSPLRVQCTLVKEIQIEEKKKKEMENTKIIRPLNRHDWCTYEHMETEAAWDARAETRSGLPNPEVVFI